MNEESSDSNRMGAVGNCVCPKCGATVPHIAGTPCRELSCPNCNAKMMREGSEHHQLLLKAKERKSLK